jgi:hypothetical protein
MSDKEGESEMAYERKRAKERKISGLKRKERDDRKYDKTCWKERKR